MNSHFQIANKLTWDDFELKKTQTIKMVPTGWMSDEVCLGEIFCFARDFNKYNFKLGPVWKLALAHSLLWMWKASGEYKSLIIHPFGEYDFHFWENIILSLKTDNIPFYFPFYFQNISEQELTSAFF